MMPVLANSYWLSQFCLAVAFSSVVLARNDKVSENHVTLTSDL